MGFQKRGTSLDASLERATPYTSSAWPRTMTYTHQATQHTEPEINRTLGMSMRSFGICQVLGDVTTPRPDDPMTVESAGRITSSPVSIAQHHQEPKPEVSSGQLLCADDGVRFVNPQVLLFSSAGSNRVLPSQIVLVRTRFCIVLKVSSCSITANPRHPVNIIKRMFTPCVS